MVIRSTGKIRNEQTKMLQITVVQTLWIINFIPMSETLKCQKMNILESLKHSVVSNPQNVSAKEVWYPLTSLRCCPCKIVVIVISMIILPNSYWAVTCARNGSKLLHGSHLSIAVLSCERTTSLSPFCWWGNWGTERLSDSWQSESQIQIQVELNLKVMVILFK